MLTRISRTVVLAAVIAFPAFAGEEPGKCHSEARECEQEIRKMMTGRRYLGAVMTDLNPGVAVKAVTADSPAGRAGLKPGDRIVAVNGQILLFRGAREFKQAMGDTKTNGRLTVVIQRRGTRRQFDIKLEPLTKEQIDKIVAAHVNQSHNGVAGSQQ